MVRSAWSKVDALIPTLLQKSMRHLSYRVQNELVRNMIQSVNLA